MQVSLQKAILSSKIHSKLVNDNSSLDIITTAAVKKRLVILVQVNCVG